MTYEPKIVHLPGTTLTPEVVVHRTLQKLDRIKAVLVVIQWDDETFDLDWSQMKTSELCMAAMCAHRKAARVASGEDEGR